MAEDTGNSDTRTGRPRKGDGPKVPYDEIDRLLVHGEVVEVEAGGTTLVYPSYRKLAERYGCAHSLIAQYSRKHDCLRRRKETKARVAVRVEQKLVEMRAKAIAMSKDDALQIIDAYLAGFGEAIAEGRVRFDNPTDFNTMLRLKEFILGGADSRQEIHAALSLEDIQARHARMLRASQQASAEVRGEVIDALPAEVNDEDDHLLPVHSPAPPTEAAAQEVPGQPAGAAPAEALPVAATRRPSRAAGQRADNQAGDGPGAPQGANVAPTGPSVAAPASGPTASGRRAARSAGDTGDEGAGKVCAGSGPSSANLVDDGGEARDTGRTSRSSAALRPTPAAGPGDDPASGPSSRVLPGPCGEGVGEGSRASGEHAPQQDEVS